MDILEIMKTNPGIPNGETIFLESNSVTTNNHNHHYNHHHHSHSTKIFLTFTTFIFVMVPSGIGDVPLVFL